MIPNGKRLKTFFLDQEEDQNAYFRQCYSTLYWKFYQRNRTRKRNRNNPNQKERY